MDPQCPSVALSRPGSEQAANQLASGRAGTKDAAASGVRQHTSANFRTGPRDSILSRGASVKVDPRIETPATLRRLEVSFAARQIEHAIAAARSWRRTTRCKTVASCRSSDRRVACTAMTHDLTWFTGLGLFALGLCACDLSEGLPGDGGSTAEHGASEGNDSATPGSTSTGGGTADDGNACNAVGCAGIHLLLVPDSSVFDGQYQIQVFAPPSVDVATECSFVVSDGSVMESSCGISSRDFGMLSFGFPQVFIAGRFETMRIDVIRDGAIVASLEGSPEYMEVAPTEPECGPVCLQAEMLILLESPTLTACNVNGEVWPHGARVDDPFSCNSCLCEYGQLTECTERDCPVPCPEGTGPGTRCTNCGPGDTCRTVLTGCLETCNEGADCEGGSCIDGLCRHHCGDI